MSVELLIAGTQDEAEHWIYTSQRTLPADTEFRYVDSVDRARGFPEGTRVRFVGRYWNNPAYDPEALRAAGYRLE